MYGFKLAEMHHEQLTYPMIRTRSADRYGYRCILQFVSGELGFYVAWRHWSSFPHKPSLVLASDEPPIISIGSTIGETWNFCHVLNGTICLRDALLDSMYISVVGREIGLQWPALTRIMWLVDKPIGEWSSRYSLQITENHARHILKEGWL